MGQAIDTACQATHHRETIPRQLCAQTLGAAGGTLPYRWAVGSGRLPIGLTLNAATGHNRFMVKS